MISGSNTNVALEAYDSAQQLSVIKKYRHVLVIDDESTGRNILDKIIQQIADNIIVTTFESPKDALIWLENNDPDLIVTDYRMPEMNGVEFIQHIRQKTRFYFVPILMISIVNEKEVRYKALDAGATAFLTRPIDHIECRTSCRNLLQIHEQHLIISDRAEWLAHQVNVATEQVIAREKETIIRLAKAGEYRDEGTSNHVVRMAKYARQIAEATGKFTEKECEDLEYAAPMHDIGKIGIPDKILLKPNELEPDEREIMKQHAIIGHSILSDSHSIYMQIGAVIALNHHERFDGKGYPNGLKGEDIPLIARVVSVADTYDALVSARPYKLAWPNEEAINYIKQEAGTQFDPLCVQAFIDRLDAIKKIQLDYADDLGQSPA